MKKITRALLPLIWNLHAPLVFADSTTNTSSNTSIDPLSMTQAQLEKLPAATLESTLQTLQSQNEMEKKTCREILSFNTTMCAKRAALETQCMAEAYLIPPVGADSLGCTENNAPPVRTLSIEATGLQGLHFRLRANKDYISNEFSEGLGALSFQRSDNQSTIMPPRFNEIITLSIISVTANSSVDALGQIRSPQVITDAQRNLLLQKMKIRIKVDGSSISDDTTNDNWLKVVAPADESVQTEMRIDPYSILRIGRNPMCLVSLQDIDEMRQESSKASETTDSTGGDCE